MRISQLNTVDYITYNFGGITKVQSSPFYSKFLQFMQPPYHLLVVKPWNNLIDFSAYGYSKEENVSIYDGDLNYLSTFSLPKLFTYSEGDQDYYLTQESYDLLKKLNEIGVLDDDLFSQLYPYTLLREKRLDLEPFEYSYYYLPIESYINSASHGEFFVISFFSREYSKQRYIVLWVCRKVNKQYKESLLDLWRTNKSRAIEVQKVNQILIDFEAIALKKEDLLEVNIVPDEWGARLTKQEVETHTNVTTLVYDNLDTYLYIYPNTDWWLTFSLIRDETKTALKIKSKEGIGMDRVKEYQGGSYFIQNYKIGGSNNTATKSLFKKRGREDRDKIRGVIKIEER